MATVWAHYRPSGTTRPGHPFANRCNRLQGNLRKGPYVCPASHTGHEPWRRQVSTYVLGGSPSGPVVEIASRPRCVGGMTRFASLKVIWTDTDHRLRLTYNLLSLIHRPGNLSRTVSKINGDSVENRKLFPPPCIYIHGVYTTIQYNAPAEGVEFFNGGIALQKWVMP